MVDIAKTDSLWQRFKNYCTQGPTASGEQDRRGWGRFATQGETTYRPANVAGAARRRAGIHNISRRGIALLVNQPFEAGDLLSVDVPGRGDTEPRDSALACVVHVTEHAPDTWALGCTFSADLNAEDLAAFGASSFPPTLLEQRSRNRHRCEVQATCQRVADSEQPAWEAHVQDISALGVGLLTAVPIEAGTLLNVRIRNLAGEALPTLLACVVHTTAQPTGDWLLGCNFMHGLGEEEFAHLRG